MIFDHVQAVIELSYENMTLSGLQEEVDRLNCARNIETDISEIKVIEICLPVAQRVLKRRKENETGKEIHG